MDLALAIEKLVPAAEYSGSTTGNTEGAFNALRWHDSRPMPTWQELISVDSAPPVDVDPLAIQALYEALPLDLQEKYEEEILFGAEWLKRGNTGMVARKLAKASAKLNWNNAEEVALFQKISELLGVSP